MDANQRELIFMKKSVSAFWKYKFVRSRADIHSRPFAFIRGSNIFMH
jgi:hypothetical protein